jgi:ABC-type uncharacterized transport system auxiliary subunit
MKKIVSLLVLTALLGSCTKPIMKQFYLLSYQPDQLNNRIQERVYPITLRLRPFEIEKAYSKSNIVYRKSPYQLEYYGYQHWAVRPKDMVTDLIYTHLESINLVQSTVRRLDENGKPDYELAGKIIALEEYDSGETWFAHLAIRMTLVRLSDGEVLYNRLFDQRKIVENRDPLYVVRTLSELTDFFASTLMNELDEAIFNDLYTTSGDRNASAEK